MRFVLAFLALFALAAQLDAAPSLQLLVIGDDMVVSCVHYGHKCWRQTLYEKLTADGWAVDYVGSRRDDDGKTTDPDNEGHMGWTSEAIRFGSVHCTNADGKGCSLEHWSARYKWNFALVHLGANDAVQFEAAELFTRTLEHLGDMVKYLRSLYRAPVVVSTVLPHKNPDVNEKVEHLNSLIEAILASKAEDDASVIARPIEIMDLYNQIDADSDLIADNPIGIPTAAGEDKIAEAWYQAMLPALREMAPELYSKDEL